jgi:4-alpha-glucanotransferase
VTALRDGHNIPGMAVLQFGFGDPGAHIYLPQRLSRSCVIYTGTHDNDTTVGWWNSNLNDYERRAVLAATGDCKDGINWGLIRLAQNSVASLSVVPMQDVLGLSSEARMNTPSTINGNFLWRYKPGSLTRELSEKLAALAEVSDRIPADVSVPYAEEFVA